MDQKEVLKALRHLKVETGSPACLGCGHENSCSTKGCAVIRAVIEILECIFGGEHDGEINLCMCCAHIERMERCKIDVGCSRCREAGCPCQNCRGGSNWQQKSKDEEGS